MYLLEGLNGAASSASTQGLRAAAAAMGVATLTIHTDCMMGKRSGFYHCFLRFSSVS